MDKYIPQERIESKIYLIRAQKVMIDRDLSKLYNAPTRALNRAVKRNLSRFPNDFIFQLTEAERDNLKCHFGTSSWGGDRRNLPFAFTEQGVAMLSSVLRSDRAVKVNIEIMRTFVRLKRALASNAELAQKIEELEKKCDHRFSVVLRNKEVDPGRSRSAGAQDSAVEMRREFPGHKV